MGASVRIREDAQADIVELEAYYSEISTDLVRNLRDELALAFSEIADRPASFALVFADVRRVLIRRFRIGVFFHPNEQNPDEYVVIGVFDLPIFDATHGRGSAGGDARRFLNPARVRLTTGGHFPTIRRTWPRNMI